MIYDDEDNCWLEIKTPVITSPANGTTGLLVAVILVVSVSAFVPQIPGITLSATDIEIRTAANGGGTLVWSSSSTLSVPALTLSIGQTYYIRVRHRTTLFTSMWSTDIQIGT